MNNKILKETSKFNAHRGLATWKNSPVKFQMSPLHAILSRRLTCKSGTGKGDDKKHAKEESCSKQIGKKKDKKPKPKIKKIESGPCDLIKGECGGKDSKSSKDCHGKDEHSGKKQVAGKKETPCGKIHKPCKEGKRDKKVCGGKPMHDVKVDEECDKKGIVSCKKDKHPSESEKKSRKSEKTSCENEKASCKSEEKKSHSKESKSICKDKKKELQIKKSSCGKSKGNSNKNPCS